jgi:hypothetical protein
VGPAKPGKTAARDNIIFGNPGTPLIVLTEVEKLSEIRRWEHCFMRIASSHFRAVRMFP